MAHPYKNDPVVSELDEIAQELEKTGNADLATLVDEVSAELITTKRSAASSKKKESAPAAKLRSKKNRKPAKKEAETNHGSRRAKIASAMRKIARAQVAELEDIAAELLKEGEKKAALEVLKIAEDLDSDYEYSSEGKHSAPESKGDASKRFDRAKANKPDAKMDADEKERLEPPFGEKGEGYPLKQSAFDKQLDNLIRLAMEEEEEGGVKPAGLPMTSGEDGAEDGMDASEEGEPGDEDSDEDDGDLDMDGLEEGDEEEGGEEGDEGSDEDADDMDLKGLDLGDGDDELASMMKDMEPEDTEASDRMYGAEEPAEGEDEGEESGDEMAMPGAEDENTEDEEEEGEPEDEEASGVGALQGGAAGASLGGMAGGPAGALAGGLGGAAMGLMASAENKTKMLALAKKLSAKGEKGLAARVAKLAQTKK